MAHKIVDTIRRTGTKTSPIRHIEVIQGSGKSAVREVLSTEIVKLKAPEQFRNGPARTPVEQYHFQVGSKVVERFADAAALVLRKHQIRLADPSAEGLQTYVKKAFDIIEGRAELSVIAELPEGFKPAVEAAEAA